MSTIRRMTFPNRPASAQEDYTIPKATGRKMRIVGVNCDLNNQEAGAASWSLRMGDTADVRHFSVPGSDIAAGALAEHQWSIGWEISPVAVASNGCGTGPLPDVWWERDVNLRVAFTQTTGVITSMSVVIEEM